MLYKYTGYKFKVNGETVVSNGDILTLKIDEGKMTNNTTGKDIPDGMDLLVRLNKYFKPLDVNAEDIDEETIEPQKFDKVNHPGHYTWLKDLCGIEVIDITRHMDFNLGNAIKYILRCGHKEELGYSNKEKTIEDLKKAIFYINDKIEMISKE